MKAGDMGSGSIDSEAFGYCFKGLRVEPESEAGFGKVKVSICLPTGFLCLVK
jgi:hypothetical protein